MGDKTSIEWAANADGSPGATWNPIRARDPKTGQVGWHCVHASDGCRFCYAERMNNRLGTQHAFKPTAPVEVYLDEQTLLQPIRWKRGRVIFVCSMTDLFADFVDEDWIEKVFAVMALAPQHTFIVLTKRADRMRKFFAGLSEPGGEGWRDAMIEGQAQKIHNGMTGEDPSLWLAVHMPLPNVWLGVSIEDRKNGLNRAFDLGSTPAAVRFWSVEPFIGDLGDLISLCFYDTAEDGKRCVDWVIAGGESGPGARATHPQWARDLRDACVAERVPFFWKQWGEWAPFPITDDELQRRMIAANDDSVIVGAIGTPVQIMRRVGRAKAGRLLDGREWNERPPL